MSLLRCLNNVVTKSINLSKDWLNLNSDYAMKVEKGYEDDIKDWDWKMGIENRNKININKT